MCSQQTPGCPGRPCCTRTQTHQLPQNNCCSLVMPQTKQHLLQEHWKCPTPSASKSSRSFSRKLSHLIWVAMQHEHHTRALFGRQGSTLLSKGSPTRCSCRSFCSSGDKRARLLHGVLTRSQHVPSPPLHTECRAKPPSEQGYWHRPPKTVLVTFYLQFFIAALDPRFLNLLKLHSHTQAGSYSKKGHPKLLLERCHCST